MIRFFVELVRYFARLIGSILTASALLFLAIEVSIPGGFRAVLFPNGFNPNSSRQMAVVDEYHLDDPVLERWARWVGDAMRGDFGTSTRNREPVVDLIWPRLSISLELMLVGVGLAVAFGLVLGLAAARWDGQRRGSAIDVVLGFSQSVPVFITSLLLIRVFALEFGWLPPATWVRPTDSFGTHLRHLVLPAATLAMAEMGTIGRVIRADVLRVVGEEYITAASAKGLSSRYVLFRHALRPASLGLLNVIGLSIGSLLSGAILVELIFGIGGLGQLVFESSIQRDLPLLLGLTTYLVAVYVTLNTIADIAMRALDPRIPQRSLRRPRLLGGGTGPSH